LTWSSTGSAGTSATRRWAFSAEAADSWPTARRAAVSPAPAVERRDIESRGVQFIPGNTLVRSSEDNRALVERGLALAAAGRLQPVIGQVFPLSRAADAHATIEARATIGKTILVPG